MVYILYKKIIFSQEYFTFNNINQVVFTINTQLQQFIIFQDYIILYTIHEKIIHFLLYFIKRKMKTIVWRR